jgi:Flp pilus assembly protein CpaB
LSRKKYPTTTPDWQAAVRRRTSFYVLAAFLLAVLFGILVFQFFSRKQQIIPGELTSAVFAAEDIEADTRITEEMVEVREVFFEAVPDSHLSFLEQAIGEKALYPIVEGEVILDEKLAGGKGGAVAQRCPVGKWCVSIPVNWFIAKPPDLAVGDQVEIASVLPGRSLEEAGFIATGVKVVDLPDPIELSAYVFAIDDREAISFLYARANEFQLLVLLRPAGR